MHLGQSRIAARGLAGIVAGFSLAAAARAQGGFIAPERGQALAAGSRVEVRWSAPCPVASGASEAELLLSLDGGRTFPIRVTPEMAACATVFRWRLPALPTAHARLALRSGSGEGSENERLHIVSEEFLILAGAAEEHETLARGTAEWWTRQALTDLSVQGLPSASMKPEAERLVAPDSSLDISEPNPPGAPVPDLSATELPARRGDARPLSPRDSARLVAAPTPLRL